MLTAGRPVSLQAGSMRKERNTGIGTYFYVKYLLLPMKRVALLMICVSGLVCSGAVQAQMTYTGHLTKAEAGKGTVVIVQDPVIADIVNNTRRPSPSASGTRSGQVRDSILASVNAMAATRPSYGGERRQRHYEQGYRIQVYTGGNSRAEKMAAIKVGNRCKAAFSELSVYPHFVSPRWICQVGDFRNINDAKKYLALIREAGISNEARIVRCKVLVAD